MCVCTYGIVPPMTIACEQVCTHASLRTHSSDRLFLENARFFLSFTAWQRGTSSVPYRRHTVPPAVCGYTPTV